MSSGYMFALLGKHVFCVGAVGSKPASPERIMFTRLGGDFVLRMRWREQWPSSVFLRPTTAVLSLPETMPSVYARRFADGFAFSLLVRLRKPSQCSLVGGGARVLW